MRSWVFFFFPLSLFTRLVRDRMKSLFIQPERKKSLNYLKLKMLSMNTECIFYSIHPGPISSERSGSTYPRCPAFRVWNLMTTLYTTAWIFMTRNPSTILSLRLNGFQQYGIVPVNRRTYDQYNMIMQNQYVLKYTHNYCQRRKRWNWSLMSKQKGQWWGKASWDATRKNKTLRVTKPKREHVLALHRIVRV